MSLVIPALGYAPADGRLYCSLPRPARRLERP